MSRHEDSLLTHKTFHKVQGNPRCHLGCGCILLLYMLFGKIIWLLSHEWRIIGTWYDVLKWIWLIVGWILMVGNFGEAPVESLCCRIFIKIVDLEISIACLYVSCLWTYTFTMKDVILSTMLRKEMIGHDPSKGKVIHKDFEIPLLWRHVVKLDPSNLEACRSLCQLSLIYISTV